MRRAGPKGTHARPSPRTLAGVHDRAPELGDDDAVVLRELLDELRAALVFHLRAGWPSRRVEARARGGRSPEGRFGRRSATTSHAIDATVAATACRV